MGSLTQAGVKTDDGNSQPLGEGFLSLRTSAGNFLYFRSPAELNNYKNNSANAAQLGRTRGEGDVRGR